MRVLKSPADGGAPGDAAGGDAGPGDRGRHRRAARRPGCRSARSSSTWCAPAAAATRTAWLAAAAGALAVAAGRLSPPGWRGAPRRCRRDGWSTALLAQAARARRAGRAGARAARRARRARPADVRAAAARRRHGPRRRCYELGRRDSRDAGDRHEPGDEDDAWTAAARVLEIDPLLDDPDDPDRGVLRLRRRRQDHHRRGPRRCAPPSAAARSSCSPSTRRAGWPSRWASTELDNTPRRVDGVDTVAGGQLHAMMLDMKRTFDEIVEAHADAGAGPGDPGEPLLPVAVGRLSRARRSTWRWRSWASCAAPGDEWDLIVVDTPPAAVRAGLPGRAEAARRRSWTAGSSGC